MNICFSCFLPKMSGTPIDIVDLQVVRLFSLRPQGAAFGRSGDLWRPDLCTLSCINACFDHSVVWTSQQHSTLVTVVAAPAGPSRLPLRKARAQLVVKYIVSQAGAFKRHSFELLRIISTMHPHGCVARCLTSPKTTFRLRADAFAEQRRGIIHRPADESRAVLASLPSIKAVKRVLLVPQGYKPGGSQRREVAKTRWVTVGGLLLVSFGERPAPPSLPPSHIRDRAGMCWLEDGEPQTRNRQPNCCELPHATQV